MKVAVCFAAVFLNREHQTSREPKKTKARRIGVNFFLLQEKNSQRLRVNLQWGETYLNLSDQSLCETSS